MGGLGMFPGGAGAAASNNNNNSNNNSSSNDGNGSAPAAAGAGANMQNMQQLFQSLVGGMGANVNATPPAGRG